VKSKGVQTERVDSRVRSQWNVRTIQHAPRFATSRSAPTPSFSATPGPPIFGPLRSVFRSLESPHGTNQLPV